MSGGSYDYAYGKVEDFASSMDQRTPERVAFHALLVKVAKAMHDIEWVDSGDCARGDEIPAILACVGPAAVVAASRERLAQEIETAQMVLRLYATPESRP